MTQDYVLRVRAIDGATPVFKKINLGLATITKPAAQSTRQLGALTRGLQLDKVAKGLGSASRASMSLFRSMGVLAGPMESIFGLGAAGTIAGVGTAIVGLGAKWGAAGFEIGRTSKTIGVSTDDLQLFRGMAKKAGVDTDQMTSALSNLGNTLHQTLYNPNPEVSTVLDQLGITIKKTPEGIVDTTAAVYDLARAISRVKDPHTQMSIAKVFGVEDILPILRDGTAAMTDYEKSIRKTGYVMSVQVTCPLPAIPT